MLQANYNPDVLSCLANLSNDEVFTPPNLVNDILDLLPVELWSDPNAKFLDPVSKSGVFLREMAKRLMKGLEAHIPDKQERINHIFTQQLYGIAITELTSLLSRRSVYCSKNAMGKYSVCETFTNEQGNLHYERLQHTWKDGKCIYCGASQEVYDRDGSLETYAYNFIHTDKPEKIFNMKFDVIVGNPPYQLSTAGEENGAQAKPLYHLFVEQAKKLNPRYLCMVTPSRWFTGGWGLDDFRKTMLSDLRIREIHDFPNASDCFPGVEIKGGVSYFLWDRDYSGKATFFSYNNDQLSSKSTRFLKEKNTDVLIRYNEAIPILKKVQSFNENTFEELISTKKPFGLITNYKGNKTPYQSENVKLYGNRRVEYIRRGEVTRRQDVVDSHKLIVPKAVGSGDSKTDHIKPIYSEPGSCCTETYLLVGPFASKQECDNVLSYFNTKMFHFLVTLQKNTQDCMKKVYSFVPLQSFSEPWTDEKLYKKYGLISEEIAFIEGMIRPMELNSDANDDE